MSTTTTSDGPLDEVISQELLKRGKSDVNIAVIGLQKSGKTTLVKSLLSSSSSQIENLSPTDEVVCYKAGERDGINVQFFDTPGLCKLGGKSTQLIFQEMIDVVNGSESNNDNIDLFVYCISMEGRLPKELSDTFQVMNNQFLDVWNRVVIVLTYADVRSVEIKQEVESILGQKIQHVYGVQVPFLSVEFEKPTRTYSRTSVELCWNKYLEQISNSHTTTKEYQCVNSERDMISKPADVVLVYDPNVTDERRKKFIASSRRILRVNDNTEKHEIQIFANDEVLKEGAERIRMKLPFSGLNRTESDWCDRIWNSTLGKYIKRDWFNPNIPDELKVTYPFAAVYDHTRQFPKLKLTSTQRAVIVWHLLENTTYGEGKDQVGVQQLFYDGVFLDAYVPDEADGSSNSDNSDQEDSPKTDHEILYKYYGLSALCKTVYRKQPLGHMRRHFGEKVGFYFAWLGFYTFWLTFASFVGVFVILGSGILVKWISDVCDGSYRYDFYMCPTCDGKCDFWYLMDTCRYSRLAWFFDISGALMAVCMSIWAILFVEFWKRQQFSLQFLWGLIDHEESIECARPQFEQTIKKMYKKDVPVPLEVAEYEDSLNNSDACSIESVRLLPSEEELTVRVNRSIRRDDVKYILYGRDYNKPEYILPSRQIWRSIFVILMSLVAIIGAIVFAVLIYILRLTSTTNPPEGNMLAALFGAVVQLFMTFFMSIVYQYLARFLTSIECHRTDKEFDTSLTLKTCVFEFFNYYSSLFYIAFFRANLFGHPGNYYRIGGLRAIECPAYGCIFELTIQFIVITIGMEILNFVVYDIIKTTKHRHSTLRSSIQKMLFSGNLKLVLQYGFIAIFSSAFPLAPLFALFKNVFKIRCDAIRLLKLEKRPIPERAMDVGIWFPIITVITQIAVLSNGLLIGFTAQHIIPIQVYKLSESRYTNGSGYLDWSLSSFQVTNLLDGHAFPSFTSQELLIYDLNGNAVKDALYLPFINFSCLEQHFPELSQHIVNVPIGENINITGIMKVAYQEHIYSNKSVRDFVVVSPDDDPSKSPKKDGAGECFNGNVKCRYKGFFMDSVDETTCNAEYEPTQKYWHVLAAKIIMAFAFENIMFLISILVSYLVPETLQSMKNEILHEKMEVYYFMNNRFSSNTVNMSETVPSEAKLECTE